MRQLKITQSITNRESTALEKYLQDISHEGLVSVEEEIELARKIKKGDVKALEKLTKANLRFVVSVAKQYQNQGLSLPDLINEGNLGLIKAAKKYDETRGFKFISYAVWWIRQSIMQAISEQSRIVRVPINQMGVMHKMRKVVQQFEQEYQRLPSIDEIAEQIDLPKEKIVEIMSMITKKISMDAPISTNDDGNLLDVLPNKNSPSADEDLLEEGLKKEIERLLVSLSEREQIILRGYFGINQREMSLEEIGEQTGLTRERVRQLKEKAIKRLRCNAIGDSLKGYLGK
ncbi:RNA polymerase sigma factor RpoD/SigA [Prevotella nigrescens]|jgi:RNA polymerase sigma factor, sigma-70 family|uniref:sigma-70 family RNA polymerase sigma factor n=1 Tax=Prevotella nigrescens TaxID=28133 RepID=UPI001BA797FD|nr:RNA polymerase sigma factor RpoD/SigA [Prevotella nigrescens]QUB49718.1 RNA polymerase sigma factor RpoD/SigA [Prevotella nigrescens]QUB52828.1 RNA polymerase sigma factor RpoD/SigA [Prevotella nigrescens]